MLQSHRRIATRRSKVNKLLQVNARLRRPLLEPFETASLLSLEAPAPDCRSEMAAVWLLSPHLANNGCFRRASCLFWLRPAVKIHTRQLVSVPVDSVSIHHIKYRTNEFRSSLAGGLNRL